MLENQREKERRDAVETGFIMGLIWMVGKGRSNYNRSLSVTLLLQVCKDYGRTGCEIIVRKIVWYS